MKLKSIFSSILAVALLVGLTTSCEDELQTQKQDVVKSFKTDLIPDLTLEYPDLLWLGDEPVTFDIVVSSLCGSIVVERGFVNTGTVEEPVPVYVGLTCDDGIEKEMEPIGTFDCGGGTVAQELTEPGTYVYYVTLDPDDPDGEGECIACEGEEPVTECFVVTVCREETGFGGNLMVEGKGPWFYVFDATQYEPDGDPLMQMITVDGGEVGEVIGTVTYDGSSLILDLGDWSLMMDEEEAVKVGYYDEAPGRRPAGGKLRDYMGTDLVIPVDLHNYYVIHLDLMFCGLPFVID